MQSFAGGLFMQTFACHTNMQESARLEIAMDILPITTPRQAGIYVRQAREAQGLTRAALAKTAGVSERLLASLELGDATGIRLDKLLAVFSALGIGLFAQSDNDSITSPAEQPTTAADLPITNSNALSKPSAGRRLPRQGTPSSYGALLAQIAAEQGLSNTSDLSFGCKVVK